MIKVLIETTEVLVEPVCSGISESSINNITESYLSLFSIMLYILIILSILLCIIYVKRHGIPYFSYRYKYKRGLSKSNYDPKDHIITTAQLFDNTNLNDDNVTK